MHICLQYVSSCKQIGQRNRSHRRRYPPAGGFRPDPPQPASQRSLAWVRSGEVTASHIPRPLSTSAQPTPTQAPSPISPQTSLLSLALSRNGWSIEFHSDVMSLPPSKRSYSCRFDRPHAKQISAWVG